MSVDGTRLGRGDGSGVGKRRRKSGPERRAEIVAATVSILADEGLHAWTTAALAQRVGVSEATLFRHFSSKTEILSAALEHEARALRHRVARYQGEGSAWDRLVGLVLDVTHFLQATGGGPLVVLSGQASRVSPETRQEVTLTRNLLRSRLAEFFRQAVTECDGRRPIHPLLFADLAVAIIHSTGLRWMADRDFPLQREAGAMLGVLKACVED